MNVTLTDIHCSGGKEAAAHSAFGLWSIRPRVVQGHPRRDPSAAAADAAANVLHVRDGGRQGHSRTAPVVRRVRHVRDGPQGAADAYETAVLVVLLHL